MSDAPQPFDERAYLRRKLKDAVEERDAYRHVLDTIVVGEAIDARAMCRAVIIEQDILRGRDSDDLPEEGPEPTDLTFDEIDARIRARDNEDT